MCVYSVYIFGVCSVCVYISMCEVCIFVCAYVCVCECATVCDYGRLIGFIL